MPLLAGQCHRWWAVATGAADDRQELGGGCRCQLCKRAVGTLLHRHVCGVTLPVGGWGALPDAAQELVRTLTRTREEVMRTRGILALRLPSPVVVDEPQIRWRTDPPDVTRTDVTLVIDGSLFDREHSPYHAAGGAIVVINSDGDLLGWAEIRMPTKTRTAAAAECVALQIALALFAALPNVLTDCLSLLVTLRGGFNRAVAAHRPLAGMFNCIRAIVDDDLQRLLGALGWMPAHKAMRAALSARKSDGTLVRECEWRANRLADAAAKGSASEVRAALGLAPILRQAQAASTHAAAQLGAVTHAANNLRVETTRSDGTTVVTTRRDSVGPPAYGAAAATRRAKKQFRKARALTKGEAAAVRPRTTTAPAQPRSVRQSLQPRVGGTSVSTIARHREGARQQVALQRRLEETHLRPRSRSPCRRYAIDRLVGAISSAAAAGESSAATIPPSDGEVPMSAVLGGGGGFRGTFGGAADAGLSGDGLYGTARARAPPRTPGPTPAPRRAAPALRPAPTDCDSSTQVRFSAAGSGPSSVRSVRAAGTSVSGLSGTLPSGGRRSSSSANARQDVHDDSLSLCARSRSPLRPSLAGYAQHRPSSPTVRGRLSLGEAPGVADAASRSGYPTLVSAPPSDLHRLVQAHTRAYRAPLAHGSLGSLARSLGRSLRPP